MSDTAPDTPLDTAPRRFATVDPEGRLVGFHDARIARPPEGAVALTEAQWLGWLADADGFRWNHQAATLEPYTEPTDQVARRAAATAARQARYALQRIDAASVRALRELAAAALPGGDPALMAIATDRLKALEAAAVAARAALA